MSTAFAPTADGLQKALNGWQKRAGASACVLASCAWDNYTGPSPKKVSQMFQYISFNENISNFIFLDRCPDLARYYKW